MAASENQQAPVAQPAPAIPEKELVSWSAASRPFKKRDRDFYITLVAIAGIFGLILFLVEGVMPVLLIISLIFLFYVLSTVEPEKVEYSITNKGIKVGEETVPMEELTRFWFGKKLNSELLIIETTSFPGRREFVLADNMQGKIKSTLKKYIPEEKASPSRLDKAVDWIGQRLPLQQ